MNTMSINIDNGGRVYTQTYGGRTTWGFSLPDGSEGSGYATMEDAAQAAAECGGLRHKVLQHALELLLANSGDMISHAVICEFSAEDSTPTLHIDLWRGFAISDLPECVNELVIVAEGHWDGGRSYSLQA